MHSVARLTIGAFVCGFLILSVASAGAAADVPSGGAGCDPLTGKCDSWVNLPGARKRSKQASPVRTSKQARRALPDPCTTLLADPQPPKSDPVWAGNTDGAIYLRLCPDDILNGAFATPIWRGAAPAAPQITPRQLAERARASLQLPKPALHRSPDEANRDDGKPYTWVKLWTWYWTSSQNWRTLSRTATAGALSATVTVKPAELQFTPGNGDGSVSCPGPGRPWTQADGNGTPDQGGCGYRYLHIANSVQATMAMIWTVTWSSSDGQGGALPDVRTQTTSAPFRVQQIQAVTR